MSKEPVLMYCVGAAKSGTSWLYRYLSGHPECHFRAIKELHYFNSFDQDRQAGNISRIAAMGQKLRIEIETDLDPRQLAGKIRQLAHVEDYLDVLRLGREDSAAYLAYLNQGRDGAKVVGEMTPAYSLLDQDRLRQIAQIAGDVRFVYLLRDPVERLWSHIRMAAFRRSAQGDDASDLAEGILARVLQGGEGKIARRSDYAGALANLGAAIDSTRLLVAVYEDIFSGDALARITDFLGIAAYQPNLARVVHGGQPLNMSDDQRARAARWLAPQYDASARLFGRTPEAWATNLTRVS